MDNSRHYVLRGAVGHISIHLQAMMKLHVEAYILWLTMVVRWIHKSTTNWETKLVGKLCSVARFKFPNVE